MFSLPTILLATPEKAQPADAFVDSIGINVKLNYADTPYGDFGKLETALKKSGMRHIRDGLIGTPDIQQRLLKLHDDGIGSTLIVSTDNIVPNDPKQLTFYKNLSAVAPAVDMLEGPNETDAGFTFDGKSFPESLNEFQRLFYHTAKTGPYAALPIIAPSIGYPPNSSKAPNQPGDYGNTHSYHGSRNPGTSEQNLDLPKFYLQTSALVSPGKKVICTETGNTTAAYADPSLWMPRITEWAQGKYAARTYLEYFNAGILRTFIHEFIDEHPNPHLDEQNFGIMRNDWSPKPAYSVISNMISILRDPGNTRFTTSALDYTVTGDTANVHHTLLQKRDGTYYLVLWKEVPSYDPQTFQDIGVPDAHVKLQVSPAAFDAAYTYQPMSWSTPSALLRTASDGAISLNVTDEPMIVQLLPAGADLVVSSAGVVGDAAHAGTPVKFKAVITNRGTASTPPGLNLAVTFFDASGGQSKMLTYGVTSESFLAPGQSVTIMDDHDWTPPASGHYKLDALVDDVQRIPESSTANNNLAFSLDVK